LRLVVNADLGRDTISRHIYGQFAEHLGRDIYDGFWTKSGSGRWHLRDDVVAALRKIQVPNLRWPGGCFADRYHWKDGIGAPERRPTIVNTMWGNVTEDNSFGTHEYLELVDRLGAAPFIVGNVGSGTPQEMAEWWEYVNFDGTSPMTERRRNNGRKAPWNVRFWGVGNESWGCGGNMTPEYYADVYKRFATFLAPYGPARPFRIATGPNSEDYRWTDVVMHDVEPGTNPGFLYQQNTLRDALVASVSLDVFNRHADRVRMANIAQTINVLQAMILTQGERMILTPTYHVFELYTVHHDATLLPISLAGEGGRYEYEGRSIPAVSASASRDREGRIHVTLTNLDPNYTRTVSAELRGAHVSRASGRVLSAAAMNAHNTFEQPNTVQPEPFNAVRVSGERLSVELPPKSVVLLELQ